MSKVWVLDTETKGTGAHVVPYEQTLRPPGRDPELALVELERPHGPEPAPAPPAPLRFKVVSVMSGKVLAQDIGVRETVELLQDMGSVLDVRIFVWMRAAGRWRLLTLGESKTLWSFRGRAGSVEPDAS